jgi:hypothetical protein
MSIPETNPTRDALRSLWIIRHTWDPKMRGIVRGLLRVNVEKLRNGKR